MKTNNIRESDRYNLAFNLAFKKYLNETKKNWKLSVPGLLLPSLNTILVTYVPPLAIAGIVAKAQSNSATTYQDFIPYVALFVGSWLVGELVMRTAIDIMIRAETRAIGSLYNEGLRQLLRRDVSFFHDNFAGSLTKKTLGYASQYVTFYDTLALSVFYKLIPVIFASVVLAFYSPWLTVCLLAWLTFAVLVTAPLIKKRRDMVMEREIASNLVSGHVADIYGNIDTIRAHASEDAEGRHNQKLVANLTSKMRRSWNYQNRVIDVTIAPIFVLTNASGLVLSIYLAQTGVIEFASIIVVFAYYMAVTSFMWDFNSVYRRIESSLSEAAQYTELLLTEPTILDTDSPEKIAKPNGSIEFKNIHFGYKEDSERLFTDFSLRIEPGQKIGLVGRSGGGKSSITKLLLRFSDVDNGQILIDDTDISKIKQKDLRRLIAYVPQDPAMFHRSIRENIAYAHPDSSMEQVIAAAKKAHAHEFIKDLPEGYETLVGERGIKLSGGQRQRVAIARAILKDAPILLLDEATSALDSESESLIQDALWKLMEGKTAIVIAHRLSTIQKMDRIVVLDKGQIIEDGSHQELLDKPGTYAGLWKHQSGGFLED